MTPQKTYVFLLAGIKCCVLSIRRGCVGCQLNIACAICHVLDAQEPWFILQTSLLDTTGLYIKCMRQSLLICSFNRFFLLNPWKTLSLSSEIKMLKTYMWSKILAGRFRLRIDLLTQNFSFTTGVDQTGLLKRLIAFSTVFNGLSVDNQLHCFLTTTPRTTQFLWFFFWLVFQWNQYEFYMMYFALCLLREKYPTIHTFPGAVFNVVLYRLFFRLGFLLYLAGASICVFYCRSFFHAVYLMAFPSVR